MASEDGNLPTDDSLQARAVGAGFDKVVYIAQRTDGIDGDGSLHNPRDGSTQELFEGIFQQFNSAGTTDITFRLGPGIFHLIGAARTHWAMLPGWKVIGSGIDVTFVVQDFPAAGKLNFPLFTVFGTPGGNQAVSDMTIDLGHLRYGPTHKDSAYEAIALAGSGSYVRRVKVINAGTEPEFGYENTIILIQGQGQTAVGMDDGVAINDVAVEDCLIHCTGKTSTITIYNNASIDKIAETRVAAGSIGATLPQSTIFADTAGFPSSGKFFLNSEEITYTGRTSTTFTGCTGGTHLMTEDDPIVTYYTDKWGRNSSLSRNTIYGNGHPVISSLGCGGFDGGFSVENKIYDSGVNADTYPCRNQTIAYNFVSGRVGAFAVYWATRTSNTMFLFNTFVANGPGPESGAFRFSGDPNGPTFGNVVRFNRCIDNGGAAYGLVINDGYGSMRDNLFEGNIIDDTGWTNGPLFGNAGANTRFKDNGAAGGKLMIPNANSLSGDQ